MTQSPEFTFLHFDEIFEEFSKHTIRTKTSIRINGAIISSNIYIPDSFVINGFSISSLKGKVLKTCCTEKGISIEGILDSPM
ncbi:MAG: hypothetical protein V4642_02400 [Bacteroidota bacterium]